MHEAPHQNHRAFYSENDPFAAAWLRNLIAAGLIAPGDVDDRSIVDVRPSDLVGYSQCHFFAGIGVWSYACRCAGWPDHRPIWTGSCPCQPFSGIGQGNGFADERHLWPEFFRLIGECSPRVVVGEQVASPDGLAWLDLVHTDLENANYAFAAFDLCAAGIGAPHIRQRLFWVGHGIGAGLEGYARHGDAAPGWPLADRSIAASGSSGELAVADGERRQGQRLRAGLSQWQENLEAARGSAVNGFWRDADWLRCRDERWRPVEPGTFPMADGIANRMGLLRGYGNAVVAPLAQTFIEAVMEAMP